MRKLLLTALPALAVSVSPSHAQVENGSRGNDSYIPTMQWMVPMGTIFATASGPSWARPLKERCGDTFGCVVVVNTTRNFDITGFYVDARKPNDEGPPRWSTNQFNSKRLRPRAAVAVFRTGDMSMCDRLVRVTLRNPRTKEELDAIVGTIDLCDDPLHQNLILPIKVVQPEVILHDPDDPEDVAPQ